MSYKNVFTLVLFAVGVALLDRLTSDDRTRML